MWSKLEEVFTDSRLSGIEYARQGSFDKNAQLPASFFTFWNADTPEGGFYDDEAHKAVWVWYIYFYTNDASLLYSKLEDFITIAKEKGFIAEGRPKDLASGEDGYSGRYIKIKYIENYNIGGNENE